jgi:alpha-L-fucosidase
MSDIKFSCPACQIHIAVDSAAIGQTVACPDCGHAIVIPHAAGAAADIMHTSRVPQKSRRKIAFIGAAAFVILLSLAGAAFWVFGKKPRSEKIEPPRTAAQTAPRPSKSKLVGFSGQAGLFIHWGLLTFTGDYYRGGDTKNIGQVSPSRFAPNGLDARQWARIARQNGMTFALLNAKFEDGFALWPSSASDYSVTGSPFKKDIIAGFIAACRAEGIAPGVFYSLIDVHNEGEFRTKGPVEPPFFNLVKKQLTELHTQYPGIRIQAIDMATKLSKDQFDEVCTLIQRLNPDCVILGDQIPPWGQNFGYDTVIRQWFWNVNETPTLVEAIVVNYRKAMAKNLPFLLNVGPDQAGRVPEDQVALLGAIKEAMALSENVGSATGEMEAQRNGNIDGVGVTLHKSGSELRIQKVLANSPAAKADLKAGQIITAINGLPVANMKMDDIVKLLRGPADSELELAVAFPGSPTPQRVQLIRSAPGNGDDTFRPMDSLSALLTSGSFTEESPFIVPADPAAKRLLVQQVKHYMALPPAQVRAHPAAADFPGVARAGSPRVTRVISVHGAQVRAPADALYAGLKQGWQSTGLYANAGEVVIVTPQSPLPAGAAVKIIVGCHTDQLFKDGITQWRRFPMLTRSFTLGSDPTPLASAFGGPLFVAVELANGDFAADLKLDLRFANAVEAPYFVLGQTSPADWKQNRSAPAPWAELVGHNMILHVPTSLVRAMSFPAALLEWWDKVVIAQDALVGWPARTAQERVVTDRQISVGSMHAGFPFMCTLGSAAKITDLADLSENGDWGFFHELGHNHQSQAWTFPGQTEVTVNFFSLYCAEHLIHKSNPAFTGETLLQRLDRRLGNPPSADPFDQLAPFVVLLNKYGWAPLRETLASYQTAPISPDAPLGLRQTEFIRRYSRYAKADLTRFFKQIGYDCPDRLSAELGSLPAFDFTSWRAKFVAAQR